jgi:hypothetical protein
MVAERKELERNVLAQQLGRAYQGIKAGPSRGTVIFISVIVAAVLIYFIYQYFARSSAETHSLRWLEVDAVLFPEQLDTLLDTEKGNVVPGESFPKDTPQYRIAQFKEARSLMAQGLRDLGSFNPATRTEARTRIKEATELYDKLAETPGRTPLLHQEALWGAAKGYETLGGPDNIEKARERCEQLLHPTRGYPKSVLARDARKQLDRLNDDATRKEIDEIDRELKPR